MLIAGGGTLLALFGGCRRRRRHFFFFQAEDGIRDGTVTGVQTCALPISFAPAAEARAIQRRAKAGELVPIAEGVYLTTRSEERRVGKECRSQWSPYDYKKKTRYSN